MADLFWGRRCRGSIRLLRVRKATGLRRGTEDVRIRLPRGLQDDGLMDRGIEDRRMERFRRLDGAAFLERLGDVHFVLWLAEAVDDKRHGNILPLPFSSRPLSCPLSMSCNLPICKTSSLTTSIAHWHGPSCSCSPLLVLAIKKTTLY